MAGKDVAEKLLEAYNDVFADIVNGLLFDGETVVRPEELEDQAPRAIYKADGAIREIERDVAKRWVKGNIRIACVGIENQTDPDPDMPLRVYSYDGAEYRTQLLKENRKKPRYPVVTLVLLIALCVYLFRFCSRVPVRVFSNISLRVMRLSV